MRPGNLVSGLILKIRSGLFVIQDLFSVSVVLTAVALTAQNDLLEREDSTSYFKKMADSSNELTLSSMH